MSHSFTTLLHPVEKLLEAEFFLASMTRSDGHIFQFHLNAFLASSRSVTFVLQSEMSDVPGFLTWYKDQQTAMKADSAMRFFVELRNVSQKQGQVSFVGGSLPGGGWTYRFVGNQGVLPDELKGRDIGCCCAEHLSKLGKLLLRCTNEFPFHACPGRAFTEEGMVALGFSWSDAEVAVGVPIGWTDVSDVSAADKLHVLAREIEPLDTNTIVRIANGQICDNGTAIQFPQTSGADLVDDVISVLSEAGDHLNHPRNAFLGAIARRINEVNR
jgi:hypothetical protein